MNHTKQKEHRFAGQGAILLCAVLWSTSGLFIRLVDWHPIVISGSRSVLAVFVLLAVRFFQPDAKKSFRIKPLLKEAPALAACGLCYAATMILFVIANKLTASANTILLQYAAPVWAALLAWFFLKEKPHWEQWCALVLVSAGMYLVFANGLKTGSMSGDILALLSGIAFGANSVVLRMRKDGNPADILIFSHIICVLFSAPFFFLYPPSLTVSSLACIAFMGIFQIGAASALFAYGIRRVPAVQAMLTAAIEPVLNPLWVLLAMGERPGLSVIAGGAVILAAVMFSSAFSALRGSRE
jgi:drug/metabolite transporter (DMT)-like permease